MKNIDYLEQFFRKHKLSGKVTVKFTSPAAYDEYMSDIIFDNGDIISIWNSFHFDNQLLMIYQYLQTYHICLIGTIPLNLCYSSFLQPTIDQQHCLEIHFLYQRLYH